MNNLRNSSNLRSTKAAIAGATIAVVALAGAYFHTEYQKENVIAYITKPESIIQVEENYYEDLSQDTFIETHRLSR